MAVITLWRAAPVERPQCGHGAWWTPDRTHAERYTTMPGFGGPALYCTRVDTHRARLLDLRSEPWRVLREVFSIDRADYGAGELDHELIWSLSRVLASGGYDWAVLAVAHPGGTYEEWLNLGESPDPVEFATSDDW